MSAVLTRPGRSREGVAFAQLTVLIGVVAMALILGLPALTPRGRVDRLTVANPLPWHVDVRADGPDVDGAVAVGTVSRGQTGDFHGLPDVGRTWVFRFRYAGVDAGELSVSREQLEQDGWEVTVPAEAGEHLRTAGMPESAG